ncbi:P protein isoform X3 [Acyrthosiphon pisum]|uniref:Citrate transporter-like domain-containing protein n=1 Tax=Acyrthosiphon pisum TaxID=7029 RepID=A0A8R2H2L2_ACYPI|nr:P protein isoform X3 [Acyrthosiphon pisum]|eukprot:XP_016656534.1 PREDICTED: P protein isoform X3 [Acyrthosiphon pisum]
MEFIVRSELNIISNSHRNMYQRFIDDPSAGPSSTVAMTSEELEPSSLKSTTSKSSCEKTSAHNFLHAKKTSGRKYTVSVVLICIWLFCTIVLMAKQERKVDDVHQVTLAPNQTKTQIIYKNHMPNTNKIQLILAGAFMPDYYSTLATHFFNIWIEFDPTEEYDVPSKSGLKYDDMHQRNITQIWSIPIVSESLVEVVPEMHHNKIVELFSNVTLRGDTRLCMNTTLSTNFPISFTYDLFPINTEYGIIYAALVLIGLYVLIITEVIHKSIAAILAATTSISILALLDERPTKDELSSWVDIETLLLLFCMMVIVGILSETGIFDYLAIVAYKETKGKIWPLINTLCFFTAMVSSILDNVTTVLLMTPITIRLCEVMQMNPVPTLMCIIFYANLGGALTLIGDPPNVIIGTNKDVIASGIDFTTFSLHMGGGLVFIFIAVNLHLRYIFRNMQDLKFTEPSNVTELRQELAIWQKAASSLSSYSKEEGVVRDKLLRKCKTIFSKLKDTLKGFKVDVLPTESIKLQSYDESIKDFLNKDSPLDKSLLWKCAITLGFVITLFCLHSFPQLNLSLGWIALLGTLLLLILADHVDIECVLGRIEWATLSFFAALFILIGALSELGLIEWVGKQTEVIIMSVAKEYRLSVAIILVLWVSTIVSSFVDNIPLTTMMIKVITSLSQNPELELPLPPLVYALAFGGCLGGNGTLIAASCNMVCAGVAEQHGYRISFVQFFKVGYPVMLCSVVIATVYLLVTHVTFGWNT